VIVIVGGRCAGSALALLLTRAGREVLVIERSASLGPVPSTHFVWPDGRERLRRWGILDRLRAVAPPAIGRFRGLLEGEPVQAALRGPRGALGAATCLTRPTLDAALMGAACEAGAEVAMGATVTGLLWTGRRVTGVRVRDPGGDVAEIAADLVVGADGWGSRVARWAGARTYHRRPARHATYWAYVDNQADDDTLTFVHDGPVRLLSAPVEQGRRLVALSSAQHRGRVTADELAAVVAARAPVHAVVGDQIGDGVAVHAMGVRSTFFRTGAGPGWALVGDAGYFNDPCSGRGISDAFWQAETLAKVLTRSVARRPGLWAARRDLHEARFATHTAQLSHARSTRLERAGVSVVVRTGRVADMLAISGRSRTVGQVFTAPVVVPAALAVARAHGYGALAHDLTTALHRVAGAWWLPLEGVAARVARR
jgi:flavin-dependent dehydrogenase